MIKISRHHTRRLVGIAAAAVAALVPASAGAATLKSDYGFQDTLASSCCTAPSLTEFRPVSVFATETVGGNARTVRAFNEVNPGLQQVSNLADNGDYSIAMLLRLSEVSGYRKLIDFTGSQGDYGHSDRGLYINGGLLKFYPHATGTTAVAPNEYIHVVLTRSAATGTVTGYVNGTQQFAFVGGSGDAIPANDVLTFFTDDYATGGGESTTGAVARIRTWDGALSPAEVGALTLFGGSGGGCSATKTAYAAALEDREEAYAAYQVTRQQVKNASAALYSGERTDAERTALTQADADNKAARDEFVAAKQDAAAKKQAWDACRNSGSARRRS